MILSFLNCKQVIQAKCSKRDVTVLKANKNELSLNLTWSQVFCSFFSSFFGGTLSHRNVYLFKISLKLKFLISNMTYLKKKNLVWEGRFFLISPTQKPVCWKNSWYILLLLCVLQHPYRKDIQEQKAEMSSLDVTLSYTRCINMNCNPWSRWYEKASAARNCQL